MSGKNIGAYVASKIPNIVKDRIHKAISSGNYLNVSEFVRDAIKEKLEREGYLLVDRRVL